MPGSQKWIFFLNAFGMGLLAPVISLVLLSHGAVTGTLSVFTGLVATSVLVLELPSGVLADAAGRKRAFLLALATRLARLLLLMLARGPILLGGACLLFGASQAFASGTLEVLTVEQRNASLVSVNGSIAALGGVLGSIGNNYTLLLAVTLGCGGGVLVLTLVCVLEAPHKPFSVLVGLRGIRQAVRKTELLRVFLVMAALTGMVQAVLEIYWKQRFQLQAPYGLGWTIGLVGTLGYLGIIVGSKAVVGLLSRLGASRIYWNCKLLLVAAIVGLGFFQNRLLFAAVYAIVYARLGTGDVAERTLLHGCIGNDHRAGLLSVYSLVLRFGVIVSSAVASVLIPRFGVSALWNTISAAAFLWMGFLYLIQKGSIINVGVR